jgi:short-subunit dehydrogenase
MAKRTLTDKRALVTGASSGIGWHLAMQLAAAGVRLVVVARREEKLKQLAEQIRTAGGSVETVVGDVTDPLIRSEAIQRAVDAYGGLDLLVNNAGIGALGAFEDADPARLRKIMEVNFFSVAELIREALPHLKDGQQPMVVNVSSVLGHRGVPRSAEYCASKFAMQGLSDSLRAEFSKLGIDVLVVCPSTTQTEFFDSVLERTGRVSWEKRSMMPAAKVAEKTLKAMRKGKHEIVLSFLGKLLVWGTRRNPWLLDHCVAKWG